MTDTQSLARRIAFSLFDLERKAGEWNNLCAKDVIDAISAELAEHDRKVRELCEIANTAGFALKGCALGFLAMGAKDQANEADAISNKLLAALDKLK